MTKQGQALKQAENNAKARHASLANLMREYERRQVAAVRDQQRDLRNAFYARHPELAAA